MQNNLVQNQNKKILYQTFNPVFPINVNPRPLNKQINYNIIQNQGQNQNVQKPQVIQLQPQAQIIKKPYSQGAINFIPHQIIVNPNQNQMLRKTYDPIHLRQPLSMGNNIYQQKLINSIPIQNIQNVRQNIPIQITDQLQNNKIKNNKFSAQSVPIQNFQNPQLIQQNNLVGSIYIPSHNNVENVQYTNPNKTEKDLLKKSATLMTVKSLADIPYEEYPQAQKSNQQFFNISGFASNSYNGKIKKKNEDKSTVITNHKKNIISNNLSYYPNISYFGIFDGHGGDKCSIFLKNNLHKFLFNSPTFPINISESIKTSFITAENEFQKIAIQNHKLVDKSGSCALIALIVNNDLYAINLGDSRGLYSRDGGKELYQITRDHKPDSELEKRRIEKNGGKVYYANSITVNGAKIVLKEDQFGEGFKFPYRLDPGGLAVSF